VGKKDPEASHPTAPGSDVVWKPRTRRGARIRELRVALPRLILTSALARVLPRFRNAFPTVKLHIEERDASAAAAVLHGAADVAVYAGADRNPQLTYQLLPHIPMLVASPREYRWDSGKVSPRALARHPLIAYPTGTPLRALFDTWFERAGITRREIVMTVRDTETVLRYVGLGLGHSIVPRLGLRTSHDYHLCHGVPGIQSYQPVLVYRAPRRPGGLPEATAALIEMLEEVWPVLLRLWKGSN